MQTLNENWGACDLVLIVHELHQRGYDIHNKDYSDV